MYRKCNIIILCICIAYIKGMETIPKDAQLHIASFLLNHNQDALNVYDKAGYDTEIQGWSCNKALTKLGYNQIYPIYFGIKILSLENSMLLSAEQKAVLRSLYQSKYVNQEYFPLGFTYKPTILEMSHIKHMPLSVLRVMKGGYDTTYFKLNVTEYDKHFLVGKALLKTINQSSSYWSIPFAVIEWYVEKNDMYASIEDQLNEPYHYDIPPGDNSTIYYVFKESDSMKSNVVSINDLVG